MVQGDLRGTLEPLAAEPLVVDDLSARPPGPNGGAFFERETLEPLAAERRTRPFTFHVINRMLEGLCGRTDADCRSGPRKIPLNWANFRVVADTVLIPDRTRTNMDGLGFDG